MKKIQILGTGCRKCETLYKLAETAANELEIEYELVKIKDLKEIMSMGVMLTPGMVIDGKVKVSGKLPSIEDIKKMIKD